MSVNLPTPENVLVDRHRKRKKPGCEQNQKRNLIGNVVFPAEPPHQCGHRENHKRRDSISQIHKKHRRPELEYLVFFFNFRCRGSNNRAMSRFRDRSRRCAAAVAETAALWNLLAAVVAGHVSLLPSPARSNDKGDSSIRLSRGITNATALVSVTGRQNKRHFSCPVAYNGA